MTFETEFLAPMQREIKEKVEKPAIRVVREAAEATYNAIFDEWPAFTYWSLTNHRIAIGGSLEFDLVPQTRPTDQGALAGQVETTKASELAKLNQLEFDSLHVVIGNAVPYAEDVNLNPVTGQPVRVPGSGLLIYIEAAAEGTVAAEAAARRG